MSIGTRAGSPDSELVEHLLWAVGASDELPAAASRHLDVAEALRCHRLSGRWLMRSRDCASGDLVDAIGANFAKEKASAAKYLNLVRFVDGVLGRSDLPAVVAIRGESCWSYTQVPWHLVSTSDLDVVGSSLAECRLALMKHGYCGGLSSATSLYATMMSPGGLNEVELYSDVAGWLDPSLLLETARDGYGVGHRKVLIPSVENCVLIHCLRIFLEFLRSRSTGSRTFRLQSLVEIHDLVRVGHFSRARFRALVGDIGAMRPVRVVEHMFHCLYGFSVENLE